MNRIEIDHITKDYGEGKGVFDISFSVKEGEVMGFLGPNGAGKTTTIRQLMGFVRPDRGILSINGMDCFLKAWEIEKSLGYLPGETAYMDDMRGIEFIKFIAGMKGMKDLTRARELIKFLELDAGGKIKKMSKGMKQKIGIVCAFMQEPEILILDEPTSGLDPLMQNKFIELVLKEKESGTTILMSSHIFEEVERTCDRVAIIRNGRIAAVEDMMELKKKKRKIFEAWFDSSAAAEEFAGKMPDCHASGKRVTVEITGNTDQFIKAAGAYTIMDLAVRGQTLEELFMDFYGEKEGQNA